jgi:osmotically-inducible protein OsmY
VTLKGHVRSFAEKFEAEKAVKGLTEVQAVANDLEVRLPSQWVRDDEAIGTAALNALSWRADIPSNRVKVIVDKGWLRLEGDVDWDYQRKAAEKAVRHLIGVRGVANLLTVKPRVLPKDVKERIQAALKRSAALEAENIEVVVNGGTVTLHGAVRTWGEWHKAAESAWAAPGVTVVKNNLAVNPYVVA